MSADPKDAAQQAPTRDELVAALRPHGAEIREADEWRPLADHVLALLGAALERAKAAEQALATIGTEAGLAGLVSARGWPLPEQLLAAEQRAEELKTAIRAATEELSVAARERDEATAKLAAAHEEIEVQRRIMARSMPDVFVDEIKKRERALAEATAKLEKAAQTWDDFADECEANHETSEAIAFYRAQAVKIRSWSK